MKNFVGELSGTVRKKNANVTRLAVLGVANFCVTLATQSHPDSQRIQSMSHQMQRMESLCITFS